MLVYKTKIKKSSIKNFGSDRLAFFNSILNGIVEEYRKELRILVNEYFFGSDSKRKSLLKILKTGGKLLASIFPIFTLLDSFNQFKKNFFGIVSKTELDNFIRNIGLYLDRKGEFYIGFDLRNKKYKKVAFMLEYGGLSFFYPRIISKVNKKIDKYIKRIRF